MLPGGMMPVTQLIAMIRSSPAKSAIGLLTSMPADRMPHVIAGLAPRDIARLLPLMRPEFLGMLAVSLTPEQLSGLIELTTPEQAVALVSALPTERFTAVGGGLSDQAVLTLLAELPEDRQSALRAALDPHRLHAALSTVYERDVAAALARANAEVSVPEGAPRGTVVARTLGWRIVVAARFGDDGRVAIRDAEAVAYRLRATGALSVTNYQPADDVLHYCHEARLQGRPIGAVAWVDLRHDGTLKRALVHLIQ